MSCIDPKNWTHSRADLSRVVPIVLPPGSNFPLASPVCCSGCTQSLVQLLDECPLFSLAVQSRKRFEEISLEKVMHKKNYSVFGRINFYAVIKNIVVCLGGSLDLEWILVTLNWLGLASLLSLFYISLFHKSQIDLRFRPFVIVDLMLRSFTFYAPNC